MTELNPESLCNCLNQMPHHDNADDDHAAEQKEEATEAEPHGTIVISSSSSSSAQSTTASPDTDTAMEETHMKCTISQTDSTPEIHTGSSTPSSSSALPPSTLPAHGAIPNTTTRPNGNEDAKPPLNLFPQIQNQRERDHHHHRGRGPGPGWVPRATITRTRRFSASVVLLSSYNKRTVTQDKLKGGKKKGKPSTVTRGRNDAKKHLGNLGTDEPKDKKNDHERRNTKGGHTRWTTETTELRQQRAELERLEAQRDRLAVAWIVGRHIRRVCRNLSADGGSKQDDPMGWKRYVKSFAARYIDSEPAEPSFDPEILARYIERLVMATEPWQAWCKDLQRLYRWEQPLRTAMWYAFFTYLWRKQRVMSFLYAYIIYIVLKRRLCPPPAQSMRESLDRALDRGILARRIGELVTDRHARERWLEPPMRDIAPHMQGQIGDLAAFLEVLQNFYHWREPRQTAASLFFFASCLALSLVGDREFCMNVFWFLALNTFFLAWPVADHFPQYRFLVSPFRWAFWDIPSHPEWVIQYLQRHDVLRQAENQVKQRAPDGVFEQGFESASEAKAQLKSRRKSTRDGDALPFPAFYNGQPGDLALRTRGLCFVTARGRNASYSGRDVVWSYPYSSLIQMTKKPDPRLEHLAGLELEVFDPAETRGSSKTHGGSNGEKHAMTLHLHLQRADRDEAFILIVGRSRLPWRVCEDPSST